MPDADDLWNSKDARRTSWGSCNDAQFIVDDEFSDDYGTDESDNEDDKDDSNQSSDESEIEVNSFKTSTEELNIKL